MANPNPNEPNFPFGGGTDNPGDDTSKAGGPTSVVSVETAPLQPVPHATGVVNAEGGHPALVAGIAQTGTDTPLPQGTQAVPPTGTGFESAIDRGADPSGGVQFDPISGETRVSGQDETLGETETTSGVSPAAFPEPNP